MSPLIMGLALVALGLIGAFFGYRIFRVMLPIYGGVAGFLIARALLGLDAWLLELIIGIALAVVLAVLAYGIWSLFVSVAGLIAGASLGVVIGTSLNLWGWLTAVIAIGLGIIAAALFFWIRNEMVIISTASTGASLAARGVGEMFGWRSGLEGIINPNSALLTTVVVAFGILVFIAGLLYQWRAYLKLHLYDRPVPSAAQPAAPAYDAAARATNTVYGAAGVAGSTVAGSGAAVASAAAGAAAAAAATSSNFASEVSSATSPVFDDRQAAVSGMVDDARAELGETVATVGEQAAAAADWASEQREVVTDEIDAAFGDARVEADVPADWVSPQEDIVTDDINAAFNSAPAEPGESVNEAVDWSAAQRVAGVELGEDIAPGIDETLNDLEGSFADQGEIVKFNLPLARVPSIGQENAEKLNGAGAWNLMDLLRLGATRKGRLELAEATGLPARQILEWVNHADLHRVPGVTEGLACLLEAAGVDTVPELAQRNAGKLIERLLTANNETRLIDWTPAATDAQDWIAQAKTLPRIVQY